MTHTNLSLIMGSLLLQVRRWTSQTILIMLMAACPFKIVILLNDVYLSDLTREAAQITTQDARRRARRVAKNCTKKGKKGSARRCARVHDAAQYAAQYIREARRGAIAELWSDIIVKKAQLSVNYNKKTQRKRHLCMTTKPGNLET